MDSRAKLFGHPVHQMLIVFPLGLLGMAVVFDVIRLVGGSSALSDSSYYMIAAGVVSGLVAAIFGFIDWLAIPTNTRARSVGAWHALGNVLVLLLFAASWWLRRPDPTTPPTIAIVLAIAGGLLALVTGWLGGELVDRLGVGVDSGAHLDAQALFRDGQPADTRKGPLLVAAGAERHIGDGAHHRAPAYPSRLHAHTIDTWVPGWCRARGTHHRAARGPSHAHRAALLRDPRRLRRHP